MVDDGTMRWPLWLVARQIRTGNRVAFFEPKADARGSHSAGWPGRRPIGYSGDADDAGDVDLDG